MLFLDIVSSELPLTRTNGDTGSSGKQEAIWLFIQIVDLLTVFIGCTKSNVQAHENADSLHVLH